MSQRTLDELVQSLPAELYNNILDLTLTINSDTITLTKDYKPPVQLQIDRASRKAVAKTYYPNTIFVIKEFGHFDLTRQYLTSLPRAHVKKIKTLRCLDVQLDGDDFEMQKVICPMMLMAWKTFLGHIDGFKERMLYISIKVPKMKEGEEEGEEKVEKELQWHNRASLKRL